jgi:Spy/CpxP family protein refolding chaperone
MTMEVEMGTSKILPWSIGVLLATSTAAAQAQVSPYAGQQSREIKALSTQEVDDLLNARGLALAKAAELNGYPGPTHVLDLASELKLTPEQRRAITNIKDRMQSAAKPLGAQIVARERELDRKFAAHKIAAKEISAETREIGNLFGRLRAIHLSSHLETTARLEAQQIARYNELRGYGSSSSPQTHDPAKSHGG